MIYNPSCVFQDLSPIKGVHDVDLFRFPQNCNCVLGHYCARIFFSYHKGLSYCLTIRLGALIEGDNRDGTRRNILKGVF
jgi:hypothetical protein